MEPCNYRKHKESEAKAGTEQRTWQRSNEPVWWSLFGMGGMVAALILPVLVLLTGLLIPLGLIDAEWMSYERMRMFAGHWLGSLIIFVTIALPVWHGQHRLYHLLHDLKVGGRQLCFVLCYGIAFTLSVACVTLLMVM